MKKSGWMVLACLLGGPALGLLQEQKIGFEAKDGEYSEGTSRFKIVGVCHTQELSQECWDVTGKRSKSVEELYVISRRHRDQLYISVGKRNLLLLTEGALVGGPQLRFFPGDGYVYSEGNDAFRLALEPSQVTFSVIAELPSSTIPRPTDIFLDRSKPADVGGVQWTFVKASKLKSLKPRAGAAASPSGTYWSLVFETRGEPTQSKFGPGETKVVGKDGNLIHYVDGSGKPLADTEVVAMGGVPAFRPDLSQPRAPAFRATLARIIEVSPTAEGFGTNVDPKYIAAVRQYFAGTTRVLFRDLPAYPADK